MLRILRNVRKFRTHLSLFMFSKTWSSMRDVCGRIIYNTTQQPKKIWVENMQFFMYFRRGIECRFPFFVYTYRFLIISVVYLSRVVAKRIVGSRNLILLSPTRSATGRDECATMNTLVLRKRYVYAKNGNRHSIPRRIYNT